MPAALTTARFRRRAQGLAARAVLAALALLAVLATGCGGSDAPAAPVRGAPLATAGEPDVPVAGGAGDAGDGAALFEPWAQDLAPMVCGRPEGPTILEVNGGGVALFDADGDVDVDLLLVIPGRYPAGDGATGGTNRLYRNDGGSFTDVTAGSGVDVPGWCNGAAVADVDSDGRLDVYLTRLGPNVLLANAGGCRFEAVPDAAGAAGDGWSTTALFVDTDRDGDMDLYVARYLDFDPEHPPLHGVDGRQCLWMNLPVMCGPQGLPPQADRFYRNDGGRFVEATAAAGFTAPASYGLGAIDGDWNGDGWPDVFVSNDSMPNLLFLSRGDGTVREAGLLAGAALSARGREVAGMGIASGDADADGDEDLVVTTFSLEPDVFYVNRGDGHFADEADPAGLGAPSRMLLGWGAAFGDFDLDGDLDLLTANGHVYPQADAPGTGTSYSQPNQLWRNDGRGHFALAHWPGGPPAVSRALALGDIDGDGVSDVVITRLAGPPEVLRGTADAARSLAIRLAGPPGNPDGCGSVLRLRDAGGERVWRVRSAGGYQAACDSRAVFAWRGAATLDVVLPDGRRLRREISAPGPVVIPIEAPR